MTKLSFELVHELGLLFAKTDIERGLLKEVLSDWWPDWQEFHLDYLQPLTNPVSPCTSPRKTPVPHGTIGRISILDEYPFCGDSMRTNAAYSGN